MVGLSSILADTAGDIVFDMTQKSKLDDTSRRVSRTKTLDGGCVIVDGGFSESDKTLTVSTKYNVGVFDKIKHLHERKPLIHVSVNKAFYSGTISKLSLTRGIQETVIITILIKEKLGG